MRIFGMLLVLVFLVACSSAPAPAPVAKVGQPSQSAGVVVTVSDVQRLPQMKAAGGFTLSPEAGQEFVLVKLTIENTGANAVSYSSITFRLKDAAGQQYKWANSIDPQALKTGELATGNSAQGTVAYQVPQGTTGLFVSYEPLVAIAGYQPIRVALD